MPLKGHWDNRKESGASSTCSHLPTKPPTLLVSESRYHIALQKQYKLCCITNLTPGIPYITVMILEREVYNPPPILPCRRESQFQLSKSRKVPLRYQPEIKKRTWIIMGKQKFEIVLWKCSCKLKYNHTVSFSPKLTIIEPLIRHWKVSYQSNLYRRIIHCLKFLD